MVAPRWFYRIGWAVHRAVFAVTGGRVGASRATGDRLGTLFLLTTGRRTGQVRRTGLFYLEDGPNLVVIGSNAGASADPGWWRNLQQTPNAEVQLGPAHRPVRGRRATPAEADACGPGSSPHPPATMHAGRRRSGRYRWSSSSRGRPPASCSPSGGVCLLGQPTQASR